MRHSIKSLALIALFTQISCASNNPVHMDTSGPEMEEILSGKYRQERSENISSASIDRSKLSTHNSYEGFTRDAMNEIDQLFPMHNNPNITVFIHPHLATKGNYPIPGYTTAFTLYEKNEYALPSEIAPSNLNDNN